MIHILVYLIYLSDSFNVIVEEHSSSDVFLLLRYSACCRASQGLLVSTTEVDIVLQKTLCLLIVLPIRAAVGSPDLRLVSRASKPVLFGPRIRFVYQTGYPRT